MDIFIFFCVLLSIKTVQINGLPIIEEKDEIRSKRDLFENIQSAVQLGISEITGKFQEGFGIKDDTDRELNFFGYKIGNDNKFKTGFGEAVENSNKLNDPWDDQRVKRDIVEVMEGEEIIVDSGEVSEEIYEEIQEEYPEYDNYRKKRDVEVQDSGETFVVVERPDERRKRSAMRSYAMKKGSDSDSDSNSSSSEEQIRAPSQNLKLNRNKRAAKPCYFGRRVPTTGGGGTDTGTDGDAEALRSSRYRRQRGKRQAPNQGNAKQSRSTTDSDEESSDGIQDFMEKMADAAKKVAAVAKKVQEAFENQSPTD